jgi:SAM-dependent methyltransferase
MSVRDFLLGRSAPLIDRPEAEFWWHSSPLPDGTRIRSRQDQQSAQSDMWDGIAAGLAEGLDGRRVLDVGAADGFFSIAARAAGAAKVSAIDCDYIGWPNNIRFLNETWQADVEILTGDFSTHSFDGQFDVILLLGVLYHATDVFSLISRAWQLLHDGGKLVIETHMSQDTTSPYPLFEAASDVYPSAGRQAVEAIDKVGVSNFLFPNTPAMFQLAHMYRFAPSGPVPCDYSTKWPSRHIYVFTKLDASAPRWTPPQRGG